MRDYDYSRMITKQSTWTSATGSNVPKSRTGTKYKVIDVNTGEILLYESFKEAKAELD